MEMQMSPFQKSSALIKLPCAWVLSCFSPFWSLPFYVLYPRRRQWHPTPVLLPGKSQGRRSLVGCSPWGHKESDTTERLHFHFSLSCTGEGMATHSSVLAWRIPGTGEPGGLRSMGSHRVGQDWSNLAGATAVLYPTRLLCPSDSPGKDTGVGCHALQRSNLGLLHCRRILYCWNTGEAYKLPYNLAIS